jgi:type IV pilus assembly protein PilQ
MSSQPKITITFQDADIREVIAGFAVFSGRTIVAGKGVTGTVTAEIRDQPWDLALRAILSSQGYAAKEDQDGIISIDSYENIAKQQATEPLQTRIISVNYARASSLVSTVKGLLSKDCPAGTAGPNGGASTECKTRGDVSADSGTNRLLVTDVASRLEDIANYVKDLDVRTPQVSIKTKIILVDRTNIQDIGVSYDLGDNGTFFNKLVQRTDPSTFKPIDSNGDGVPDAVVGTPFPSNTQVINIGGNSLAAISNATQRVVDPALSLIFSTALGKFNLTAFLDGLQEVRLSDVEAEPSIVTLDNREAQILSGEETPIRIVDLGSLSQGSGTQAPRATVQFKETGIILKVTPHITNNRKILMTLHAERSQLQPAASDLGYTFLKQSADNELLVGDGETAVIGGLTTTQVQQSKSGIPLLVDLPFIGKLFGETRTQEDKTDLLILVTPHIVDDGDALGAPGADR